jgi:hypothetical protein
MSKTSCAARCSRGSVQDVLRAPAEGKGGVAHREYLAATASATLERSAGTVAHGKEGGARAASPPLQGLAPPARRPRAAGAPWEARARAARVQTAGEEPLVLVLVVVRTPTPNYLKQASLIGGCISEVSNQKKEEKIFFDNCVNMNGAPRIRTPSRRSGARSCHAPGGGWLHEVRRWACCGLRRSGGPSPGFWGVFIIAVQTVPLCWVWGPGIAVLWSCHEGVVRMCDSVSLSAFLFFFFLNDRDSESDVFCGRRTERRVVFYL